MKFGSRVKCYGYLKKKKLPYISANQEDEHIENENEIQLSFGEQIDLNLYDFIEKEFEGIFVGTTYKATMRSYISDTDGKKSYIFTDVKEMTPLAKVYFGNCKSRLVPICSMVRQTTIDDFLGDSKC